MITASATAPSAYIPPKIVGDSNAATRLTAHYWELAAGEQLGSYSSIHAAAYAARKLSIGDEPTLAIFRNDAGFGVHEIEFGTASSTNWRELELNEFALRDVMDQISTGGYMMPIPDTQLVGLVDSDTTAHLSQAGRFSLWGFAEGLPIH